MNKIEALTVINTTFGELPTIVCNGMIGRELYSLGDKPNRFYMIGSMGIAASIAQGLAYTRPDKRVVVIEGDGNTLMGLGSLAQIGAQQTKGFIHLCLDNGRHASTGDQHTISEKVKLENIALGAGYERAWRCNTAKELEQATTEAKQCKGPVFILAKVDPGTIPGVPRVEVEPPQITERFRGAIAAK